MTLGFNSRLLPILALALVLPGFNPTRAAAPTAMAAAAAVDTYTIDKDHSEATFRIRHLIGKVSGKFPVQGTIWLNTGDITKSRVEVTIDAAGINTSSEARDKDLRGPRFFDVAKYPTITFKSTSVAEVGKGKLEVTGTLTMHGVDQTIVIPMDNNGTGPGMKPGSFVASFEGNLKLDRTKFGISTYASDAGDVGALGKEVTINLSIEADKVQPAS